MRRRGQRDLSAAIQEWRYEVGIDEHGARLDKFLLSAFAGARGAASRI